MKKPGAQETTSFSNHRHALNRQLSFITWISKGEGPVGLWFCTFLDIFQEKQYPCATILQVLKYYICITREYP